MWYIVAMTPKQAIDHFSGQARLAEALGVSLQVVNNWKRRGWIPLESQIALHDLTGKELQLSRSRRSYGQ
jgi:DNA-binding transcriptional regulator Cro